MIAFTHEYRGHTATFTLLEPLDPSPALWRVALCGYTNTFTTKQWDRDGETWVKQVTT